MIVGIQIFFTSFLLSHPRPAPPRVGASPRGSAGDAACRCSPSSWARRWCCAQSRPHQVGSNLIRPLAFVAVVPGGRAGLPAGPGVPAGHGRRRSCAIGTYGRPGPPLRLTVDAARRPAGRGPARAGLAPGRRHDARPELGAARRDARVCLRNEGAGPHRRRGRPADGAHRPRRAPRRPWRPCRLAYTARPPRERWLSLAPAVVGPRGVRAATRCPAAATLPLFALLALRGDRRRRRARAARGGRA